MQANLPASVIPYTPRGLFDPDSGSDSDLAADNEFTVSEEEFFDGNSAEFTDDSTELPVSEEVN